MLPIDYKEKESDITTIYSDIKKCIFFQDEQILKVLTSVYKNIKLNKSDLRSDVISKLKENILLLGPTGSGKSEIVKRIVTCFNVPVLYENAYNLSNPNFIEECLNKLLSLTNGGIEKAQSGILVIDGFEEMFSEEQSSNCMIKKCMLQRLLDGEIINVGNRQFDTSKLTIICIGKILSDDKTKGILNEKMLLSFSQIVTTKSLTKENWIEIIKNSKISPVYMYKKFFKKYGYEFNVTDDFIDYVATAATFKLCGAKNIKRIFDEHMSDVLLKVFKNEEFENNEIIIDIDSKKNVLHLYKKNDKL